MRFTIPIAALAVAVSSPAAAQESNAARDAALASLSQIFGALHHIRRVCDPEREGDIWRNQMKRLIELEQPAADVRDQMVGAFNDGYTSAQRRFDYCDNDAEDFAAARAATGRAIIAGLAAPLYAAARGEEDESVDFVRGNEIQ
jgi:uncharacterized protein (TIGR02301 family)